MRIITNPQNEQRSPQGVPADWLEEAATAATAAARLTVPAGSFDDGSFDAGSMLSSLLRSFGAEVGEKGSNAAPIAAAPIAPPDPLPAPPVVRSPPPPASAPTGDARMLGQLDALLADDQIAALMERYGGQGAPAISPMAIAQVGIYGAARFEQLGRYANAMQAVRDQYTTAFAAAQDNPDFTITVPRMVTRLDESGNQFVQQATTWGDGDPVAHPVFDRVFDAQAFTDWYERQPGLANQAFKDFYGRAYNNFELDETETTQLKSVGFDNNDFGLVPSWHNAMGGGRLAGIDLNAPPELFDPTAIAFDPVAGCFGTSRENLKDDDGDWFETAFTVMAVAGVAWVAAPLAAEAAVGMGMGTTTVAAGATTTTLTVGGAAVAGGLVATATALTSGLLSGDLRLKNIIQSALSGAVTAGLTNGLTGMQAVAARTLVQGGVQALAGGKFEDGALTGLVSGIAAEFGNSIEKGIQDAVKGGTLAQSDVFAARMAARIFTSSVKILAKPDNPSYAFASEYVGEVLQLAPVPAASASASASAPAPAPAPESAPASTAPAQTAAASRPVSNDASGSVETTVVDAAPGRDPDDDRLMGTPRRVGTVGAEGSRGAWGIAESLAGEGASTAEVNAFKNRLLTLNPELAVAVQRGQSFYTPDDATPDNLALARASDRRYQDTLAQARADDARRSPQEPDPRPAVDTSPLPRDWNMRDAFAAQRAAEPPRIGSAEWFRTASDAEVHAAGYQTMGPRDLAAEGARSLAEMRAHQDMAFAAGGPVLTSWGNTAAVLGAPPPVVDALMDVQSGLAMSFGAIPRGEALRPIEAQRVGGEVPGVKVPPPGTLYENPLSFELLARRTSGEPGLGTPYARSLNPLAPVQDVDRFGNEIYYRTMSDEQFARFERFDKLPPTTETSMSPKLDYASKYEGVTVKLVTEPGTSGRLQEIGMAANRPAAEQLPDLPPASKPWMDSNVRFKVEQGQMTTQLGRGPGINILNGSLVDYQPVAKRIPDAIQP